MTGIYAICSSFGQSRQPILSMTSKAIRANSQTHVRHSSILFHAHSKPSSITPASQSIRTAPALTNIFNVNQFGRSSLTVSKFRFVFDSTESKFANEKFCLLKINSIHNLIFDSPRTFFIIFINLNWKVSI